MVDRCKTGTYKDKTEKRDGGKQGKREDIEMIRWVDGFNYVYWIIVVCRNSGVIFSSLYYFVRNVGSRLQVGNEYYVRSVLTLSRG